MQHLNTLKTFKETQSLTKLASEHLGLELLNNVWQTCPACKKRNKFIVNDDTSAYCIHPRCTLHRHIDIIDLFKLQGYSFREALRILGVNKSNQAPTTVESTYLDPIFKKCRMDLFQSKLGLAYLEERYGITKDQLHTKFEIGYTPGLPNLKLRGNRIVFPVRDIYGSLRHLHTRALDPEAEPRWLPTSCRHDKELSFAHYLWNASRYRYNDSLIVTEGISDGIVVEKLGFPTVSILSLQGDLNFKQFPNLKTTYFLLDNDTVPLGTRQVGKYKSWDVMIPKILELQRERPDLTIRCGMPPDEVGIKDINEWHGVYGLNLEYLEAFFKGQTLPLIDFVLEHYWQDKSIHLALLHIIDNPVTKEKVEQLIRGEYPSCIDYIKEITNVRNFHNS